MEQQLRDLLVENAQLRAYVAEQTDALQEFEAVFRELSREIEEERDAEEHLRSVINGVCRYLARLALFDEREHRRLAAAEPDARADHSQ
jgi:hypothetical protein